MKFEALLQLVANAPLFETGLLLAGDVTPAGTMANTPWPLLIDASPCPQCTNC